MDANEKTLNTFTTRLRQLILQFGELKQENNQLRDEIAKRDDEIANLEGKLTQAHDDYESLKMAKMLEITDGDMENAQKRLAKLIRDVNKCITLLSDK